MTRLVCKWIGPSLLNSLKLFWFFCFFCLRRAALLKHLPEGEIPKEDKDKYQEEFHNFQQEIDRKKEDFLKEHPDVQGEPS